MKTVKELPDGRTEVETVINGCNVTVVFAKDDNPEVMKNVTDLIMSAYAERIARDAQESAGRERIPIRENAPGFFAFLWINRRFYAENPGNLSPLW